MDKLIEGFVRNKMWNEKSLSKVGKYVLLKVVVESIPICTIFCFRLPSCLCNDIHRLMARFIWGKNGEKRKLYWLSWDKMCRPKALGGLGFKN